MAALLAALGSALAGVLLLALTCMVLPAQAPTIGHLAVLAVFPVLLLALLRSRP